MNNSLATLIRLPDLALVRITGADALTFLHGQLSQDVTGLPEGQARLAAYCTPKGRMLGSLVIWKASDAEAGDAAAWALVKADIAEALVKRISMFIMRAKAKLTVEKTPVYGLMAGGGNPANFGPSGGAAGAKNSGETEAATLPEPWQVRHESNAVLIGAPAGPDSPARAWLIPQEGWTAPVCTGNTIADGEAAHEAWLAADIAAGLPWIQAAAQDLFIPQTLNFDLIGGVNFTKGCYPGQEVVARAHYRGTIKRRMARGVAEDSPGLDPKSLSGTDIFDALNPDAPAGRIVNAARADGALQLLMEVQLSDLGDAEYRLGTADGPAIVLADLPYEIQPDA